MRYYDLDINGKVKGSYAVPQPEKTLILLEDAPDDASMYDGKKWIPDQDILSARVTAKADEEKEVLIQVKMRDLAISALKVEGKLDNDGKIVK